MTLKLPVSVLVVIHTPALEVLLLERAARAGLWQSVTCSLDHPEEALQSAARREVREETGIEAPPERFRRWPLSYTFEVYPAWRHRFVPGTVHNTEHVFSLEVPLPVAVRLSPGEHTASVWLPWTAAAERCFSWSNRDAIRMLASRA